MPVQPIRFGDEGEVATRELLRLFDEVRERLPQPPTSPGAVEALQGHLRAFEALDRQYGSSARLTVEGADDLVAAALTQLAHLELATRTSPHAARYVCDLIFGVALWALRHEVALHPVEPVANALAIRSNTAANRQELAAVFGLMQGVIEHVRPRLGADLERSDPQRPWRVLHANLAITAIRTEDPELMDHAFDALDAGLPGECAAFYGEALALALAPGVAPAVRERLEARQRKWTRGGKTADN